MRYRLKHLLILLLWASHATASVELQPFMADSIDEIAAARHGQAFIVVLWSVNCPPCLKELIHLQQSKNRFSRSSLVLVATDDRQSVDKVEEILNRYDLGQMDNWMFSGSMPERLRFAIDPFWYGELPRTYFYDDTHQRSAHSGVLTQTMLQQWLNK